MQLMDVTLHLLNATRIWQEDSLLSDLFIRRASYSSYKLNSLVYTKTVDSAFRALWLDTQSVNILHYSLIHLQFLRASDAKLA